MTVIRSAGTVRPYFLMAREAAQDKSLSWEARGLLCYLTSLPDDWSGDAESIAAAGPDGLEKVELRLAELRAAGYVDGDA